MPELAKTHKLLGLLYNPAELMVGTVSSSREIGECSTTIPKLYHSAYSLHGNERDYSAEHSVIC